MKKFTRLNRVQAAISTAIEEDLQWLSHGRVPGVAPDKVYNPWMPFQAAEFTAMMAECVAVTNGGKFLDVGSGIGTKVLLAREVFGMTAEGIEIDRVMAEYALNEGRFTICADALDWPYDFYDVIWMYRPFRDGLLQAKLEHLIFEQVKPGAIVAGGAWETRPRGFEIVIDDWDTGNRGAWKKPLDWKPVYEEY